MGKGVAKLVLPDGAKVALEAVHHVRGFKELPKEFMSMGGILMADFLYERPTTSVHFKMRPEESVVLAIGRVGWDVNVCHHARPDPADIILAEQDKLLAKLNDPKLRVWTRGVVALMVGALREHGREEE